MGRATQHEWDAIRERYVTSPERVPWTELAKEFGIRRETVTRRGRTEDWEGQRKQYRHQVAMKTRERTSAHEAEIRARHLNIAKQMIGVAAEQLMRKRRVRLIETEDGEQISQPPEIEREMTLTELRHWFRDGMTIERQAMGEAQEVEAIVKAEAEEMLRRLERVLAPEEFRRAVAALLPERE